VLGGDVGELQCGHTLQLDGGLAAIHADIRVATMSADVVVRGQKGQCVALDMHNRRSTGDEVRDDVLATELLGEDLEGVALHAALAGRPVKAVMYAAADRAVLACAGDDGVVT